MGTCAPNSAPNSPFTSYLRVPVLQISQPMCCFFHKSTSVHKMASPFSLATASHNTGAINYIHRYTLTVVFTIFVRICPPNITSTTNAFAAVLQHISSGKHAIVAQHDPPKYSASLSSPINYPRSSTTRPFATPIRVPPFNNIFTTIIFTLLSTASHRC